MQREGVADLAYQGDVAYPGHPEGLPSSAAGPSRRSAPPGPTATESAATEPTDVVTALVQAPVHGRLDAALADYLATIDDPTAAVFEDVSIESIAHIAGVSRATAYRYFGDRDGLILRGAIELTRRHTYDLLERQAALPTLMARIEESFVFVVDASPVDRLLHQLMFLQPLPEPVTRAMNALAMEISAPMYLAGQADGQLRDDLSLAEIVEWLQVQRDILMARNLSEPEVRAWVRKFVLPALRPANAGNVTHCDVGAVLATVSGRLEEIQEVVQHAQRAIGPDSAS
jgi:AcrR family transcriptional regulator